MIDWIKPNENGLFVSAGDFYIDPLRPVSRAVISHGHADHARPGHDEVRATRQTLDIMRIRYGKSCAKQMLPGDYGSSNAFEWNGVRFWLEPAGHVLGSAQVVLEYNGQRVVYSGDYKRTPDPTCLPFRLVTCDVFITEATFGLPIFRHSHPQAEIRKLTTSLRTNTDRPHLVGVYGLGKCQRVIALLRQDGWDKTVFLHEALRKLSEYYQSEGIDLGPIAPFDPERKDYGGEVVLAPPSALREKWSRRFTDPIVGFASGWMTVRQRAKQRNVELPLKISDHADWNDLLRTIRETECREVWITHGQEDALLAACSELGIGARPLSLVGFDDEQ